MSKQNLFLLCSVFYIFVGQFARATDMGIPVQFRLKSPTGLYPTQVGITIKLQVLTPTGGCILREEVFSSQSIKDGQVSVVLGQGSVGVYDPSLTLNQVFDNSKAKTNLTCVNSSNTIIASAQTYTPTSLDQRLLRLTTLVSSETIMADFYMKSSPYAVQAESVGGKAGADILVQNTSTQLTQTQLESLLADLTHFTNLKTLASTGEAATALNANHATTADSATTATTATTATSAASATYAVTAGNATTADSATYATGAASATTTEQIRGVDVDSTAPTSGQVLQYNGSKYVPTTLASPPVTSVAGRTGDVVLTASDIIGLTTTMTSVASATSSNVANTLVERDASGDVSVQTLNSNTVSTQNVSTVNVSTQNIYLYESSNTNYLKFKMPATVSSSYVLTWPDAQGTSGQILKNDGTGQMVWMDFPTLGGSSSLNVGTTSGTVAAGNDSRITGAMAQTTFDATVASAACLSTEALSWNVALSKFECQTIGEIALATQSRNFTGNLSGDVSGTQSSTKVIAVQNTSFQFSSLATKDILQYNGSAFVNVAMPSCTTNQYIRFNGTSWVCSGQIDYANLVNSFSGSPLPASTCSSSEILSWSSLTDSFNCTDVGLIIDAKYAATQGDILVRGASGWTVLGAGTSGQVLKTQGSGANPQWGYTSSFLSGNAQDKSVSGSAYVVLPLAPGGTVQEGLSTASHTKAVFVVPKAGRLKNLNMFFSSAPNSQMSCTIYMGAALGSMAATALVVTGDGASTILNDSAHVVSVTQGKLIDVVCENQDSADSAGIVSYTLEFESY